MSKKTNNKKILDLILDLDYKLIDIKAEIDKISKNDDPYVEIELDTPIFFPEDVYLEICDEVGEDFIQFMGVS